MGWFNAVMAVWGDNPTFSSPSGDGVVLRKKTMILTCSMIFRPRLGMGWFMRLQLRFDGKPGFSSPLGDGLVQDAFFIFDEQRVFSSPLGDGLVLFFRQPFLNLKRFSSPSGDGLVRDYALSEKNIVNDFRPRVGRGWFIVLKTAVIDGKIFVPAWGWVGS